jgi:hypothetical protein
MGLLLGGLTAKSTTTGGRNDLDILAYRSAGDRPGHHRMGVMTRDSSTQRRRKQHGDSSENVALKRLRQIGVNLARHIPTETKHMRAGMINGVPVFHIIHTAKADGDIHGMDSRGIMVLAEVKSTEDRNLPWSALREHQPERLNDHLAANGIALLVWVRAGEVFVMRWPVPGFDGKRKSITPERARELDIEKL